MLTELFGKKWIQKNLQDFNLSCRFVYIYSKWDAAANRYIVPNLYGFSFDLINFLTLRNKNIFSFPSLNRNFALSLQNKMMQKLIFHQ